MYVNCDRKELQMKEIILQVLFLVVTVFFGLLSYYIHIRRKLEKDALDAINDAEQTDKIGAEKMKQAVETVYSALPVTVKPFISKSLIEMVIQNVFDKVEEYAKKQLEKEKNTSNS